MSNLSPNLNAHYTNNPLYTVNNKGKVCFASPTIALEYYQTRPTRSWWDNLLYHYSFEQIKNYKGVESVGEYWGFVFGVILADVTLILFYFLITAMFGKENIITSLLIIITGFPFFIGTFLASLAALVRRLHDINLSGYFVLLIFIPYIGSFVLFVMSLLGTKFVNNPYLVADEAHRIYK